MSFSPRRGKKRREEDPSFSSDHTSIRLADIGHPSDDHNDDPIVEMEMNLLTATNGINNNNNNNHNSGSDGSNNSQAAVSSSSSGGSTTSGGAKKNKSGGEGGGGGGRLLQQSERSSSNSSNDDDDDEHDTSHAAAVAHPELSVAARIIAKDSKAKFFRTKIRFGLALLSVVNFIQIIVFFFLVAPPGMARDGYIQLNTQAKGGAANRTADYRREWNLIQELDVKYHEQIYITEGAVQLIVSSIACIAFFVQYVTKSKIVLPSWKWIPRNASIRNAGIEKTEIFEVLIWVIHCPIGLAHVNERFRYLNGVAVFRLYTVIQAGMEMTAFRSPMMRVVTNFLGLRLRAVVFIRWCLEFHKWKVLIPTLTFLWCFMALCFSFAEGIDFGTSMWFIVVTMTTTGYGDIFPLSASGRIVALLAMIVGLVILAYIVSQVQQLTTRPQREQRVLDALTMSKLSGDAKSIAARILLYRYRLKKYAKTTSHMDRVQLKLRISQECATLRKVNREIQLLPALFEPRTETWNSIKDTVEEMRNEQKEQRRVISDLMQLVKDQQVQLRALSMGGSGSGGGIAPLPTKREIKQMMDDC